MGQFRVSAKDMAQARRKAMRMRKKMTVTKVNFIGKGRGRASGKKMFAITMRKMKK
jgi:hypothetical protein